MAAVTATVVGILLAKPLLGGADQAFQFIQEFTGFFTPGVVVIFLLGMFWKPTTEAGALTGAIGSAVLSCVLKFAFPTEPFMERVGVVFLISLTLAVVVSLVGRKQATASTIVLEGVNYKTGWVFNAAAVGVVAILLALYKTFW